MPAFFAITLPALSTSATLLFVLFQVRSDTAVTGDSLADSDSVPPFFIRTVPDRLSFTFVGFIGSTTCMFSVAFLPFAVLTVSVVLPSATAVRSPVLSMSATPLFEKETPEIFHLFCVAKVGDSCSFWPGHSFTVPLPPAFLMAIAPCTGMTFTWQDACFAPSFVVAVIVAVPLDTPAIVPPFTAATAGLLLCQLTPVSLASAGSTTADAVTLAPSSSST